MKTRSLRTQSGRISILGIILLLLVAAAVYAAVMFAPVYMEKTKLKAKIEAVANQAHRVKDVEQLRRELVHEAELLGLDLHGQQFEIERDPQGEWIRFTVRYVREVDLVPFGKTVNLDFEIEHEEPLR